MILDPIIYFYVPDWLNRLLAGTSGIFSFIGSLYILISCLLIILRIKKQAEETTNVPLVLSLSVSDLFSSFSYILVLFNLHNMWSEFCIAQAFLMQLFELASIFSTAAISLYLFSAIVLHISGKLLATLNLVFIFAAWVCPVIFAFFLLFSRSYGPSGPWCWVAVTSYKFVFFYIELMVIVAFNVCMYVIVFIFIFIQSRRQLKQNRHVGRFSRSLLAYLGAFFIVWTIPVIYRVMSLLNWRIVESQWILLPMTILNPSQGFFNGIVFGYFARVHQSWLYPIKASIRFTKFRWSGRLFNRIYPMVRRPVDSPPAPEMVSPLGAWRADIDPSDVDVNIWLPTEQTFPQVVASDTDVIDEEVQVAPPTPDGRAGEGGKV